MSSIDDKMVEILGDFAPDVAGHDDDELGIFAALRRPSISSQATASTFRQATFNRPSFNRPSFDRPSFHRPDGFDGRRHHRKHRRHDRGDGGFGMLQRRYGQPGAPSAPGTPGTPGTPSATPAPTGQPFQGAVPIPPGNWGGGTYPPPGWSPGQPLPGYPQGWPPPGSPWPGNFVPGVSNVPQPTGTLTSFDPYGNPVFTQPQQAYYDPYAAQQYDPYGNPIYPPGTPQPTIDVTVGAALDNGMKMTEIVGCLRQAGYTSKEISSIVGACCGW
jgi:hypothetical protein